MPSATNFAALKVLAASSSVSSLPSCFRFPPSPILFALPSTFLFLPRSCKLILSISTRSSSPANIRLPISILHRSCGFDIFLYAGLSIFDVHGASIPTVASRIMRAKQWSSVTGHLGCIGLVDRSGKKLKAWYVPERRNLIAQLREGGAGTCASTRFVALLESVLDLP